LLGKDGTAPSRATADHWPHLMANDEKNVANGKIQKLVKFSENDF
jgi:hypothetical protein